VRSNDRAGLASLVAGDKARKRCLVPIPTPWHNREWKGQREEVHRIGEPIELNRQAAATAASSCTAGSARRTDAMTLLLYEELRVLARRLMDRERSGATLQPTALVHEAYVRLTREGRDAAWNGRGHFYRAAATAMRRILVERARRKRRRRHGGECERVPLDSLDELMGREPIRLPALDAALDDLERLDPSASEVVQLRVFAGLGVNETARVLGVSPRHVKREWSTARLWLFSRLSRDRSRSVGGEEEAR